MTKYKYKHGGIFKAISIALVCLFSLNNLTFADPVAFSTSKNTLAVPTQLTQSDFKEKFKAEEFSLAHDAVNSYIKTQIEREKEILGKKWEAQKTRKLDLKESKIRGNIRHDVKGLYSIMFVSVTGLLSHTGQFAHVGLSGKDYGGITVIYIDSQFFNDSASTIQKHDVDEILQWENLRVNVLHIEDKDGMRKWIKEHINSSDKQLNNTEYEGKNARQIAKLFHSRSYHLKPLHEKTAGKIDFDYEYINLMLSIYGIDEESKDVNIAAKASSAPYNLKQLALESESLERFLEIIKMIRDKKGYLTTDKTFLLTGVFEYLSRTEEIYTPTEAGISARISEGRNLLSGLLQDRAQKEKFFDFAVEYQYAYTRRERLVEIVNKLIAHIRGDPELSKKNVIKLLDIGTAPKTSGSPTAEQTLLMLKAAFPDKRIEITATDIQFPANYIFDANGTYIDSRTGIIYRKHNIIDGPLLGHDIVIGVNLLDLYKDENIRETMRTNIFGSSTAYVVTGVESKEDIYRKQASGTWQCVDTVLLMEKWYPSLVYRKLGFAPEKLNERDIILRNDISVNHEFLKPLLDMLDNTKDSRYSAIFKFLTLAYVQDNLKGLSDKEWQLGKYMLGNLSSYFSTQDDHETVRRFIEFRDSNFASLMPRSKVSNNSSEAASLIREIVNLYVLHSNDWKKIKAQKKPVKILLIQARVDSFDHVPGHLPLGLATLAACASDSAYQTVLFSRLNVLPDNFEKLLSVPFDFKLLDFQAEGEGFDYAQYLKEEKPDIIGIRTVSVSIDEANRVAALTRETLGKGVKIMYGGVHLTSLPEKTLRENKGIVDIGFLAEAEETFPHFLLGTYAQEADISSIPGLCYIDKNDRYVETPQRQLLMAIDDYPSNVKYLELLHDPQGYQVLTENCVHGTIRSKMALMITSRGCPGRCTFCPTRKLWLSPHIRYQSSEKVLKDMEEYYNKGYRIFYFRDDNLTTNKKRLEHICDGIIQRGWKIAWCCMSRVDTVDRELLLKMKQSGLAGIAFGVESGEEKTLEAMGKRANLLSARKANILCREVGINYKNYIMVGYPGENWAGILKTMLFLLDITIGIKRIDAELGELSSPSPPDYARIFNRVADDILSGRVDISEFLDQNLKFPAVVFSGANVTFTTPYPGSPLYDTIGTDIYMLAKVFKHGPGERRNNEEFESPVATNEMNRNEITDARNIIISLVDAMRVKKIDTIKSDIALVAARARFAVEKPSVINIPDSGTLTSESKGALQQAVAGYFRTVEATPGHEPLNYIYSDKKERVDIGGGLFCDMVLNVGRQAYVKRTLSAVKAKRQTTQYEPNVMMEHALTPGRDNCFLCTVKQPYIVARLRFKGSDYILVANGSPHGNDSMILSSVNPEPQRLTADFVTLLAECVKALGEDYEGSYSEMFASASVPHMHGQIRRNKSSILRNKKEILGLKSLYEVESVQISEVTNWPSTAYSFESSDSIKLGKVFGMAIDKFHASNIASNVNLCFSEGRFLLIQHSRITGREKPESLCPEYPDSYGRFGGLEMGGWMIFLGEDGMNFMMKLYNTNRPEFCRRIKVALSETSLAKPLASRIINSAFAEDVKPAGRADARTGTSMRELDEAHTKLLMAKQVQESGDNQSAETLTQSAFEHIERAVAVEISSRMPAPEQLRLVPYDISLEAPLRLDLASGLGSDLFAVSMTEGGKVLNAAITLNGVKPVQVKIKPIKESEIRIKSLDGGCRVTITDLAQLVNIKGEDPLRIYKTALIECGIIPESLNENLASILRELGGGIEIEGEVVGVPKGSGMGTSSILAATLVRGLFEITSRPISDAELLMHVTNIERRMHSLGGWQDATGGAFGGVKWIEAEPGNPVPSYTKLSLSLEVLQELKSRLLLVYSGESHFAGDSCREVMAKYLLQEPTCMSAMREAQRQRNRMYQALLKGDIDEVGLAMKDYWGPWVQMLGPLATNPFINSLFEESKDLVVGGKVSGAGGGFMFLLAKKGKEGELRDFIQRRIAGTDAKIYNWDFDDEGITMKKQAASSDIENALRLMNDIIPAQLEKGKVYEVRYDKAKLRENAQVSTGEESPAETLLNEYINCLRMRVQEGDPKEVIKLVDHPNGSLFSVICYENKTKEKTIGESHINIEGDIKGQPLRIIAMLNMAFTASHIPNNTSPEELSRYDLLLSFIKTQYKEITGKELLSKNIWHIILPAAAQIPLERLEEYYKLTTTQLQQAA